MVEVDQLFVDWADAVRRKDAAALCAMVTEDCEFWTHGMAALRGRDHVEAVFRKAFDGDAQLEQTWNEIERLAGENFVVSVGIERNVIKSAGADPIVVTQRGWTLARRCDDGRWRFARGTTNRES